MIDELEALPLRAVRLTMPTDRRLLHMCERLRRELRMLWSDILISSK